MVPVREKHMLIREDLARWLIENKIADLILGTNLSLTNDSSAISKMVSALDIYAESNNEVSEQMANLFVSIIPPLQTSGLSELGSAKIEAAQARLTSAEHWEKSASKNLATAQNILMNAETEHQLSVKAVEEAREYLESLNIRTNLSNDEEAHVTRRLSVPAPIQESNYDNAPITHRSSVPTPAKNIKKTKGPRRVK